MSNNTHPVIMRFGILCGTSVNEIKEVEKEVSDKYLYADVDEVL